MPPEIESEQEFEDLTTLPTEDGQEEAPQDEAQDPSEEDAELEDDVIEEPETFDLIVKGEYGEDQPVKKTLDELKSGYMLQTDYSRKTAELARQRDTLESQIHQAHTAHRTEYVQTLEVMRKALMETIEPEFANLNWQTLAKENPEEYIRLQARASQHNTLINQISEEQNKRIREQQAVNNAAKQDYIEKSRARLAVEIPGWSDSLYSEILTTVSAKYGFSPSEVADIIDPRAMRVMHDAMKLHKAMDKKSLAARQTQPLIKTVPASGSSGPSPRQANLAKASERARRSGSVQDAALALTLRQKARR